MNEQKTKLKRKVKNKIYCIFATCQDYSCRNDEYIVTLEKMTLKEAQKKYSNTKFCPDWKGEN